MALALIDGSSVTKYPVGGLDVRKKYPNTSFPKELEGQDLSAFNVVTVQAVDQPTYDRATHKLEEGTPALVSGTWTQVWNVTELTSDELAAATALKESQVRSLRNEKLAACDWTVLTDSPLTTAKKTEWKTYRQALRDISADSGFPASVTWPTEPS